MSALQKVVTVALLMSLTTPAHAERYRLFNKLRLVPSAATRAGMPGGRGGMQSVKVHTGGQFPSKLPPPQIGRAHV